MLWNRLVVGYHGCDADLARKLVVREDRLQLSTNDYDWLGTGAYFWEGSSERALQWAQEVCRRYPEKIIKPAVVGAVIDLGECLNVIEAEFLEIIRSAHDRLLKLAELEGFELPKNSTKSPWLKKLDRAVFDSLHQFREEDGLPAFDTVRAFFIEGKPLYPTAGIRHQDHIQICVRNPARIIGYFLP